MAVTISTRRVQDIDFIGFVGDPNYHAYTKGESERPVYFTGDTDEPSKLVVPVLKSLLDKGSKKIVLDLSKVYLVTNPIANLAFSVEDLVSNAGGDLRVMSVPTICRASAGVTKTEWNEKEKKWEQVFYPKYLDMVSSAKWVHSEAEAVEFFNPPLKLNTLKKKGGAGKDVMVHELIGDLSVDSKMRRALPSNVLFDVSVLDFNKLQKGGEFIVAALRDRLALRLEQNPRSLLELRNAISSRGIYENPQKLTVRLVIAPEALKDTVFKMRLDPKSTSRETISVKLESRLRRLPLSVRATVDFRFFDSLDKALASFGS